MSKTNYNIYKITNIILKLRKMSKNTMENDKKLALNKKVNNILANLSIITITDEVKIIVFFKN